MVMTTFRAKRPMRIGATERQPGELVPEALTWEIFESHIHCGNMERVVVDEADYVAAVEKYCPELSDQLGVSIKKEPAKSVVPMKKEKSDA